MQEICTHAALTKSSASLYVRILAVSTIKLTRSVPETMAEINVNVTELSFAFQIPVQVKLGVCTCEHASQRDIR